MWLMSVSLRLQLLSVFVWEISSKRQKLTYQSSKVASHLLITRRKILRQVSKLTYTLTKLQQAKMARIYAL